jgi:hypothetical protein
MKEELSWKVAKEQNSAIKWGGWLARSSVGCSVARSRGGSRGVGGSSFGGGFIERGLHL